MTFGTLAGMIDGLSIITIVGALLYAGHLLNCDAGRD